MPVTHDEHEIDYEYRLHLGKSSSNYDLFEFIWKWRY